MSERVQISEDEWYPVFTPSPEEPSDLVCEVPDGFCARWEAAKAEFDACQTIMRKASSEAVRKFRSDPQL